MSHISKTMAAIALRGITAIPDCKMEFDLSRERSVFAAQSAMVADKKIFLVSQNDISVENPGYNDLEKMGVVAEIDRLVKLPNGNLHVYAKGLYRAYLSRISEMDPGLEVDIAIREEDLNGVDENPTSLGMKELLKEQVNRYIESGIRVSTEMRGIMTEDLPLQVMMNRTMGNIRASQSGRQKYLNIERWQAQYDFLLELLNQELEIWEYKHKIQDRVKQQIDKNQKEYVLREQMKVIRDELGEGEAGEADSMQEAADQLDAAEEIREKVKKEIKRFSAMPSISQEAQLIKNYIDTLLEMPWNKKTGGEVDMLRAEEILEEDHYGLDEVKERVLEYLAVRSLNPKGNTPIICLAGPPGTGKTSIANSIAKALGKTYVRVCLGGVRDEAEIRGHRKTYIGAMPGRIATGIKQAKTGDPLMLLDEIDKLGVDYKGDPSAALLEVLDPEQNKAFMDHFLEVPIDLSEVFFIATANDPANIPRPLLDRMEIIEISGYTENEKFHIAKRYLVKKQLERNGLSAQQLEFSDDALHHIVLDYTREAGVRSLERQIAKVCRKQAKKILEERSRQKEAGMEGAPVATAVVNEEPVVDANAPVVDANVPVAGAAGEKAGGAGKTVVITADNLKEYLGKKKFHYDEVEKMPQIGLARGLAWTSVGGDTLEIEVGTMTGKGNLVLTGKLGDVMQESARIALSVVRSICTSDDYKDAGEIRARLREEIQALKDREYFEIHDIHIHVPEGATPKDGPSAGITMTTALYSAINRIPVRADLAMTGEVTLRGRVLPIGGLKEKLLAARQAGVKCVLVPERNRVDIEELSSEIIGEMKIEFVSSIDEVLNLALCEREGNA